MGTGRLSAQVTVLLADSVWRELQRRARLEARSVGNLTRLLVAEGLARRDGDAALCLGPARGSRVGGDPGERA